MPAQKPIQENRFHKTLFDQGMTSQEKTAVISSELVFTGASAADEVLEEFKAFNDFFKLKYNRVEQELKAIDISSPDFSAAHRAEAKTFSEALDHLKKPEDQKVLAAFIQNFIDIQKRSGKRELAAMDEAADRIDAAGIKIDALKDSNEKLREVFEIMNEACCNAARDNAEIRRKFKAPWHKKAIDKYTDVLDSHIRDMRTGCDLTLQNIRLAQMPMRQQQAVAENRDYLNQMQQNRDFLIGNMTATMDSLTNNFNQNAHSPQDNVAAPEPAPLVLSDEVRNAIGSVKRKPRPAAAPGA